MAPLFRLVVDKRTQGRKNLLAFPPLADALFSLAQKVF